LSHELRQAAIRERVEEQVGVGQVVVAGGGVRDGDDPEARRAYVRLFER